METIRSTLAAAPAAEINPVFNRAMQRFIDNPAAITDPRHPLIPELIRGWNNQQWAAEAGFLSACVAHALETSGAILECGSGLTTVLVSVIAAQQARQLITLENSPFWAKTVNTVLAEYVQEYTSLDCHPLRDYGEYHWYNPATDEFPDSFSLVLCDGPPGITPGGRYGLLPQMGARLQNGCTIVLDDAWRAQELRIAQQWAEQTGGSFEVLGKTHPYLVLNIPPA